MRHGAEPWDELAVKLMLKWPNLYYSTSAFAPRYYPQSIIDYANTRGAEKIMYAGYFPMGLSLERIFSELPHVALKDDRSEEHTSELQSLMRISYAVFCLNKKKTQITTQQKH